MTSRDVVVREKKGLHLRAARAVVLLCQNFRADVTIDDGNGRADGRSVMDLLLLAAGCGCRLTIRADGTDEEEAADALAAFFDGNPGA